MNWNMNPSRWILRMCKMWYRSLYYLVVDAYEGMEYPRLVKYIADRHVRRYTSPWARTHTHNQTITTSYVYIRSNASYLIHTLIRIADYFIIIVRYSTGMPLVGRTFKRLECSLFNDWIRFRSIGIRGSWCTFIKIGARKEAVGSRRSFYRGKGIDLFNFLFVFFRDGLPASSTLRRYAACCASPP